MTNPLKKLTKLNNTIKVINAYPHDPNNHKKGMEIKKKLTLIGIPIYTVGLLGFFGTPVCILTNILHPAKSFPFFVLFGLIASIGSTIFSYAKRINLNIERMPSNPETALTCPECSTKNSINETYCSKCGNKLM